jgi:hypothetical protein
MNNQEILGMDSANAAAKEMPYRSNMTISAALVIEMVKRITDLEAYLQKVQADRVNDIAIERKRWAKADLVALEILRLEQQAKGIIGALDDDEITQDGWISVEFLKDCICDLQFKAKALKEPKP